MDKVRRIVHPKLRPFYFQIRRNICLTRIIQWITRLRRIIRLQCEYGHSIVPETHSLLIIPGKRIQNDLTDVHLCPADISGLFLASFLSKSGILLHFLFLRYLRYLLWVFLGSMENPCYFCDICGHFGALLGFFSFLVLILVRFVIFAIFVMGVFSYREKSFLLCDICGHFGVLLGFFFFCLDSCQNCYFCDFCNICK